MSTKRTSKARILRTRRPFTSLQDYMERTGTNGDDLCRLMSESGYPMGRGYVSNILKGSRGCSLRTALQMSRVTGVPVDAIAPKWVGRKKRTSQAPDQMSA